MGSGPILRASHANSFNRHKAMGVGGGVCVRTLKVKLCKLPTVNQTARLGSSHQLFQTGAPSQTTSFIASHFTWFSSSEGCDLCANMFQKTCLLTLLTPSKAQQ